MIREISSTNESGETLTLKLSESDISDIVVITVSGLGPPKATINTLGGVTFDGAEFNSARVGVRNITMTLAVAGYPDDDVRKLLYSFFPIKKKVTIGILTDSRDVTISAYVESNQVNMFNKIEHAEISLICPTVYFVGTRKGSVVLSGVTDQFYFPFSNDSLVSPLISFGSVTDYVSVDLNYEGEVETGVVVIFRATGPISGNIIIHNLYERQKMTLSVSVIEDILGYSIGLGDEIIIDTRVGNKAIYHVRNNVKTNVLNSSDLSFGWLTLVKGINTIVYEVTTGRENLSARVEYDILYEGV